MQAKRQQSIKDCVIYLKGYVMLYKISRVALRAHPQYAAENDIIFLQETHSKKETELQWKSEWGSEIHVELQSY